MTALDIVTPFTAHEEGGYGIDRRDKGCWTGNEVGIGRLIGCTYGVCAAELIEVESPHDPDAITAETMRNLTLGMFEAIFGGRYYNVVRGGELAVPLAIVTSDFAYNAGTGAAGKCLQRVIGMTGGAVDGWIGDKTLKALAACDAQVSHVSANPTTIRAVQVAVGMTGADLDGEFGPRTRDALLASDDARDIAISARVTDAETAYYRSLKLYPLYGAGWIARTERRLALALAHTSDQDTPHEHHRNVAHQQGDCGSA